MNARQLTKLGVPSECVRVCISVIRDGIMKKTINKKHIKKIVPEIINNPEGFQDDVIWRTFAKALINEIKETNEINAPVPLKQWGENIDQNTINQMRLVCEIPSAVAAALMPDGHYGYGLSIGGVLATEGTVIPYAVGKDISCGMQLSITDLPVDEFSNKFKDFCDALEKGTLFGVGKQWQNRKYHPVLDEDWNVTKITQNLKDKAWEQLGTSGSGNHFCEFGIITLSQSVLGLKPGQYIGLLSHSGSRGPGSNVCDYFSKIAQDQLPQRHKDKFKFLAWLLIDSHEGLEYWWAMDLMGKFAKANHEIIHRDVLKLAGVKPLAVIHNHHNFAWRETLNEKAVVVHRKGATPAHENVLGIIPGSMGDPGFIVKGKGNINSVFSASHGAGRRMSRKAAKEQFNWGVWKKELWKRGVHLLSGGIDEVPGSYKNIEEVMQSQSDLVETLGKFDPKIVKMSSEKDEND